MRLIFDCETDGLLDTLTAIHCLCLYDLDTNKEYKLAPDEVLSGVKLLEQADEIIGHNIIGFDLPAIKKVYPEFTSSAKVIDTLVMARLAWSDIKQGDFGRTAKGLLPTKYIGSHSLGAYGYRLGCLKGEYGETEGAWESFSQEMLDYCWQDVMVTKLLFEKLCGKGLSEESIQLEHEVATIIQKQIEHGVLFDIEAAEKLYCTLITRKQELNSELQQVFQPWYKFGGQFVPKKDNVKQGYRKDCPLSKIVITEFNPGSRQHISYQLKKRYNWQPEAFTEKGEPMVDESILSKLPYPEAKLLSEYLMVEKRIGQLAEGDQAWLKKVSKDQRIHGGVITNGAVTGRMTHNNPNLAQVPAVSAPYGKECRSLFTVPKGKLLVGADASGLELRCLAHYMGRYDEGEYAKVILDGDIHTVNQQAAGLPTRNQAKTFIYAYLYGAGDEKIGTIVGGTSKDGAKLKRSFLKKTPALKKLKEAIDKAVKEKGYLIGLDGRMLPIRSPHAALNTLLQSAGAVVMKKALVILADYLKPYQARFVLNIHDEWQIECADDIAEVVGQFATRAIREAGEYYNFRCPLDGEYRIGAKWCETH